MIERFLNGFWSICLAMGLCACAGPTTPFGALNGLGKRIEKLSLTVGLPTNARIHFTPHRQFLHDRTTFDVLLEDPAGIPEGYSLRMSYNGLDVTGAFLDSAKATWSEEDRKWLKLTISDFRLPASREHDIQLVYRRDWVSAPLVAELAPPQCSPSEPSRRLASLPDYDPPALTLQTINRQAQQRGFNPYMVAGLIAQESGFDPSAVSSRKAMGLTQITSIVEAELLKDKTEWPRYPGLDEMSAMEVRLNIATGKITPENEWRLNPAYSIQGGVLYLSAIGEYWSKPEKRALLEKTFPSSRGQTSLEVLLASYNSGPARVSRALERAGTRWLDDEELQEGKRYVRHVVSYCDHFSGGP